ncbi:hypothetical protein [uncultured Deinococcus sp.]|uniref:hypothetical protein n=1 Tax=uncultured Deinococcus sp. TaxID=158789 RepID=UPI0025F35AB4|nr:hypothetical protein [uncultured Deinococcus sp.]
MALDRARTTAKRTNAPRTVNWTSTSIDGQALENGVTISAATRTTGTTTSAATSLSYRQPYGTLVEVGGTVPTYTLTVSKGQRSGTVRVSGVFGKAIGQPVN